MAVVAEQVEERTFKISGLGAGTIHALINTNRDFFTGRLTEAIFQKCDSDSEILARAKTTSLHGVQTSAYSNPTIFFSADQDTNYQNSFGGGIVGYSMGDDYFAKIYNENEPDDYAVIELGRCGASDGSSNDKPMALFTFDEYYDDIAAAREEMEAAKAAAEAAQAEAEARVSEMEAQVAQATKWHEVIDALDRNTAAIAGNFMDVLASHAQAGQVLVKTSSGYEWKFPSDLLTLISTGAGQDSGTD